jgi:DeoR/GlpR family transcriptional regulator of sugar metabolism
MTIHTDSQRRKLLASERRQKILEWVASEEAIDFGTLATVLDVSVMTVRRDVKGLVDQGYLTLTRGGASAQLSRSMDILVNPRALDKSVAKAQIGEYAARLIQPGQMIFVGTGSTTAQFIQFLDPTQDVTVITPSLPHASFLATRGIRTISTGGLVATEDLAQSGAIAAWSISRYNASVAVIGAHGVSFDSGLSEVNHEIAELNRLIVDNSMATWVLADPSKAGATSPYHAVDIDRVSRVVTTPDGLEAFSREVAGVCEVVAPSPSFSFPDTDSL